MGVRLNTDTELVKAIKEGLKKKDGYCPCRIERTEAYKCICEEFRAQIADPDFEGYCHCMLPAIRAESDDFRAQFHHWYFRE